ncbi:glycoside hydrolase family 63 protein [Periconia macrospinosa]|uniref:Mannosyl-oligosaccharide glucosidase n=1 Tax=Periconia macrospinosa TaxID=97972 RepID=A0A2V1D9M9_9PLEO|nr:glycoside hydrolase family 63 protein [Periconia macrospinosa]
MQLPTSLLYAILTLLPPSLTLADDSNGAHNASLLWGPYRPNLYLGIRPRVPDSLFMGLMWGKLTANEQDLRHTCETSDEIAHYGWDMYDSRRGGIQTMHDKKSDLILRTSFVKESEGQGAGNWALRVAGNMTAKSKGQKTRVVFYVGMEEGCKDCVLEAAASQQGQGDDLYVETVNIHSQHPKLGTAEIRIPRPFDVDGNGKPGYTVVKSLQVSKDRPIWKAKSLFLEALLKDGNNLANDPGPGNMHFVQLIFQDSFEFDILYSSQSATVAMSSTELTRELNKTTEMFDSRFASMFIPKPPFGTEAYAGFGKSVLSNLQGGLGYFHGDAKVDLSKNHAFDETTPKFWEKAASARKDSKPETKKPYELFSHVPSRYGFPRGFLWDEGFHLLTILEWDADLALEVVRSWFSSVDENGWIPREHILGDELRSVVPEKFVVQYPHIANPPTLFWIVSKAVDMLHGNAEYTGRESKFLSSPKKGKELISELYPKMKRHYEWWRKSQVGDVEVHSRPRVNLDEGYRWRGRTPETNLASGLDDYPRPEPPSLTELHVDALSWVGVMAETMAKLSRRMDNEADIITFQAQLRNIRSNLEALHWSEADKMYCDAFVSPSDNRHTFFCPKGYVSLFPFLTGALGPEHPHLNATLDLIRDPKHLWTDYGVRSLSPESPAYGTLENYWRGPIWMNINYLIIERLLDLAQREGPLQDRCREIYIELRANVVATVYNSWLATATIWEQYDPATGKGQRSPGFTGWTSLVVKIMAFPDLDTKAGLSGFGKGFAGHFGSADMKGKIGWALREAEEQGTWGAGGLLFCVGVMVFLIVTRRRVVGSLRRIRRKV